MLLFMYNLFWLNLLPIVTQMGLFNPNIFKPKT